MIKIKTEQEIEVLIRGGRILASILDELEKNIKPGVSTALLEDKANKMMQEIGARPTFKNYKMYNGLFFPTTLCASINNEVVHAPALPGRVLNEGDIIKVDIGMEYPLDSNRQKNDPRNEYSNLGGYYTDMARTFIVGNVSGEVEKFVNTTKECLSAGIKAAKAGNNLNDIGIAIQKLAESNGYSVVREMVGHGVGHEMHEDPQVPHYEVKDGSLANYILKPGMVIAIEPMLNMGDWPITEAGDGFTYITKDGSLSAQFEHSIAILEEGNIIITK